VHPFAEVYREEDSIFLDSQANPGLHMNHNSTRIFIVISLAAGIGMSGCSGMDRRERNTATGAVVGGVAGAVLTEGNPVGTAVGAAVGGVVGHEIDPKRK
jgi:osmotically inducible lipoprotein OsmB